MCRWALDEWREEKNWLGIKRDGGIEKQLDVGKRMDAGMEKWMYGWVKRNERISGWSKTDRQMNGMNILVFNSLEVTVHFLTSVAQQPFELIPFTIVL